ncbi:MAG TPA: capsule assembly Wzi family protein [Flavisolibacter sp.]|jgi:hypothetical protein|nr:capsule assembly Wzi family protein [Flavisolibacter sp.]
MRILSLTAFLCLFGSTIKAQLLDSAQLTIGTVATVASNDYQPLWLVANRFGTFADRKNDLSTNVRLTNMHHLFAKPTDSVRNFYVQYGAEFFANNHFSETFFKEAFVKAGYKNWQIRAGRFAERTGDVDPALSSGSLGISGNALPIPKVGFIVTDYTHVPFTNGWLQFKGQISHGWFGNNRYMKDALYHEKLFYMRFGKKKFKLYGGVQHFGEWGGRRGSVQLERSWKGFFDVLFVKEADDGSVGTDINGRPPNRAGDQRGLLEAGVIWENDNLLLRGYNQTPFETGRDVDPRNVDRLLGLTFISKKKSIIQKIVGEFLTTRDMLSFVEIRDRQSFYNNGYYKTGWEYEGRIVGTPLFVNRTRGQFYFPTVEPHDWDAPGSTIPGNSNVIVNRVVSGHLGVLYTLFNKLQAKTLLTFTQNFGRYTQTATSAYKEQLYTLQEFRYTTPQHISFIAGVGFDKGELSDNIGIMFGIRKTFGPPPN